MRYPNKMKVKGHKNIFGYHCQAHSLFPTLRGIYSLYWYFKREGLEYGSGLFPVDRRKKYIDKEHAILSNLGKRVFRYEELRNPKSKGILKAIRLLEKSRDECSATKKRRRR